MQSFRALTLSLSLTALMFGGSFVRAEDKPQSPATEKPKTEAKPKNASNDSERKDGKRHEGFLKDKEEQLKKGPIQVVFIGDSITDGWRKSGKAVWEKYYEKYNALNLGIGGDRTEHVLWRIEKGELDGLEPKAVVMMIGTNNHGSPAAEIAEGVIKDVDAVHAKLPNAKILLLAVFPRGEKAGNELREKLTAVNETLAKLDGKDNVTFLDIGPKFLEADGTLPRSIMPDSLHPNAKGYEIWAEATQPALDELTK